MDRLTEHTPIEVIPAKKYRNESMDTFLTRLAEYEDLGVPIDRLRELVIADEIQHLHWFKPNLYNFSNGTAVWYVDKDVIERGKIESVQWCGPKVESFSVRFDSGEFDEFYGEAIDDSIFMSEYEANRMQDELKGA